MRIPAAALFFLVACKSFKPAPEEAPETVCVAANAGKTVTVAGWLGLPYITFGCEERCDLYIASVEGETSRTFGRFATGFKPNQVRAIRQKGDLLGSGAQLVRPDQVVLRPDTGKDTLGIGDPVRITGVLETSDASGSLVCHINVTRAEAI
jgi:hypothetical protein